MEGINGNNFALAKISAFYKIQGYKQVRKQDLVLSLRRHQAFQLMTDKSVSRDYGFFIGQHRPENKIIEEKRRYRKLS